MAASPLAGPPDHRRGTDDRGGKSLRAGRGGTLVDPTLEHIGRDPEKLRRVSEATGVHVVMGTGFYRAPYYPEFVNKLTTQRLADYMIDEIENGAGGTGIRPGIIGEIGLDKAWVQGVEERVLRAAARAQVATGLALTTHTTLYMALEFLEIFEEERVKPDRVILGHLDAVLERPRWKGWRPPAPTSSST